MKKTNEDGSPTKEFYLFLKYNKIFDKEKIDTLSQYELEMYSEFCRLHGEFDRAFDMEDSNKASTLFGSMSSMFGFNRHFCSITGASILGSYFKIGGKIVSKEAYESYKIILELERKHTLEEKNKLVKNKKHIPSK